MDNPCTNDLKPKDADQNQVPDLGALDSLVEKIVKVPKKELDDLLAKEPKREPRTKRG